MRLVRVDDAIAFAPDVESLTDLVRRVEDEIELTLRWEPPRPNDVPILVNVLRQVGVPK